jgi:hypothetical protein
MVSGKEEEETLTGRTGTPKRGASPGLGKTQRKLMTIINHR